MSDSLTRPNPAFSHPSLKNIFKNDGIVDPVEERTICLMELCQLLVQDSSQINQPDNYGRRPIDLTTYEPLVDLLLANGASVSPDDHLSGPLHFSATSPHKDPTIHLIKGADPTHLDAQNRSVLSFVIFNDYLDEDTVETLIEVSVAVLDAKDTFGNFPLSYAVLTQPYEMVAYLAAYSSEETVQYVLNQLNSSSIVIPDDFLKPNESIPVPFIIQIGLGPKKKQEAKDAENAVKDNLVLRNGYGKLSSGDFMFTIDGIRYMVDSHQAKHTIRWTLPKPFKGHRESTFPPEFTEGDTISLAKQLTSKVDFLQSAGIEGEIKKVEVVELNKSETPRVLKENGISEINIMDAVWSENCWIFHIYPTVEQKK